MIKKTWRFKGASTYALRLLHWSFVRLLVTLDTPLLLAVKQIWPNIFQMCHECAFLQSNTKSKIFIFVHLADMRKAMNNFLKSIDISCKKQYIPILCIYTLKRNNNPWYFPRHNKGTIPSHYGTIDPVMVIDGSSGVSIYYQSENQ